MKTNAIAVLCNVN